MTLRSIKTPSGYDNAGRYRFFERNGQKWKVRAVLSEARPAHVVDADVEVAPAEMAVTVTVSPVGKDGKALREDGRPIVVDSWTHTFTATEMAREDFDPEGRIHGIIEQRISAGENRVSGVSRLRAFADQWGKE